ncbi:MAG TPA: hypothetical protein VLJ80_04295 [Solirubrobacteraceae bacterium]|nr:hypothetical protein [Solirubrobacteraceae bacterium]
MGIRPKSSSSRNVETLRLTIDCLPVATRTAMLEGVRNSERIIVGAYTDGYGGVCPMLAAHRRGGRTNFLSFAHAWDRFTRAGRASRRATPRELRILVTQLEGSLAQTGGLELDEAIKDHHVLRSRTLSARLERSRAGVEKVSRAGRSRLPDAADPNGEIRVRRLLGRLRRGRSGGPAPRESQESRQPVASA